MNDLKADLITNFTADDIACPICGHPATNQFFLETGEEYIDCHSCGYTRKFFINNLDQKDVQSEFDWLPDFTIEEYTGYGAYTIRFVGGSGTECGAFATPESEQYFIDNVEANRSNISFAKYTRFIDGVIEEIVVVNSADEV